MKSRKNGDHNGRKEMCPKVTVLHSRNSFPEKYNIFTYSLLGFCSKLFFHPFMVAGYKRKFEQFRVIKEICFINGTIIMELWGSNSEITSYLFCGEIVRKFM